MRQRRILMMVSVILVLCINAIPVFAETKDIVNNVSAAENWGRYTNNYYYKQLDTKEKAFYNGLKNECESFLVTTKDFDYNTKLQYWCTGGVIASGLSLKNTKYVIQLFILENPQYYFLSNSYACAKLSSGDYKVVLVAYSKFSDGNNRATVTTKINRFLDSWQKKVNSCETKTDKVKKIHNLIIKRSEYNNELYNHKDSFDEDTEYSQSIYSVIYLKKSVCTGYSFLFNMLCNSSDIKSIVALGDSHVWNKIKIGNRWYNVDCTWDDAGNGKTSYDYFKKSDAQLSDIDVSKVHTVCSWTRQYVPACK